MYSFYDLSSSFACELIKEINFEVRKVSEEPQEYVFNDIKHSLSRYGLTLNKNFNIPLGHKQIVKFIIKYYTDIFRKLCKDKLIDNVEY